VNVWPSAQALVAGRAATQGAPRTVETCPLSPFSAFVASGSLRESFEAFGRRLGAQLVFLVRGRGGCHLTQQVHNRVATGGFGWTVDRGSIGLLEPHVRQHVAGNLS
jgi:hypothetical protein